MVTSLRSRRACRAGQGARGVARPTSHAALALVVLLVTLGCAHRQPVPLSADAQAQLGTIGVVMVHLRPETDYQVPGRGGAAGAFAGTAKGLGLGVLGASLCLVSLGRLPEACILALGTPYFAVRYAVDQATLGLPAEEVSASEAAIGAALAERAFAEELRDQVLRLATTQDAPSLVPVPDQGSTTESSATPPHGLATGRVDTVLELAVEQIALRQVASAASSSLWSLSAAELNPPLALVVTITTRLVRAADGAELYSRTLEQTGRDATFSEWGANGAQRLRDALDELARDLAAEVLGQVFGLSVTLPRTPGAAEPDPGAGDLD